MIKEIIVILWFLLPAGVANMAPVLVSKLDFFNYPIDFNKKINGKAILGKNKTYRGLLFGIIFSILVVFLQKILYIYTLEYSLVDYREINILLLGFLLGFGALFGDSFKSFFKRQFNKKPGESWIPFDQIDWILGALLFGSLYVIISWKFRIISIIIFGILHPIVNYIGFILKIKRNKF